MFTSTGVEMSLVFEEEAAKDRKVLIEGHLDTVFPFGTVHGVEERDGFLYAPGIGDDTRALAMLLGL